MTALYPLAAAGRLDQIKNRRWTINPDEVYSAFDAAVMNGHVQVARLLLNDRTLRPEREQLCQRYVLQSYRKGHFGMVMMFIHYSEAAAVEMISLCLDDIIKYGDAWLLNALDDVLPKDHRSRRDARFVGALVYAPTVDIIHMVLPICRFFRLNYVLGEEPKVVDDCRILVARAARMRLRTALAWRRWRTVVRRRACCGLVVVKK